MTGEQTCVPNEKYFFWPSSAAMHCRISSPLVQLFHLRVNVSNLLRLNFSQPPSYPRYFSTGKWYVPTSGKLFEKRKRTAERKKRKELEKASARATGTRKFTKAELSEIKGNPYMHTKYGRFCG